MEMETLHDRVVKEIVGHLNQTKYDIYTNPGQEKNAGIGDNYPDVIMTEKGTKTVKFILEVEVADSVTQEEADRQWKKYATEINASFYIVVPIQSLNRAKELCQKNNINARFATFLLRNNNLIFNFQ